MPPIYSSAVHVHACVDLSCTPFLLCSYYECPTYYTAMRGPTYVFTSGLRSGERHVILTIFLFPCFVTSVICFAHRVWFPRPVRSGRVCVSVHVHVGGGADPCPPLVLISADEPQSKWVLAGVAVLMNVE